MQQNLVSPGTAWSLPPNFYKVLPTWYRPFVYKAPRQTFQRCNRSLVHVMNTRPSLSFVCRNMVQVHIKLFQCLSKNLTKYSNPIAFKPICQTRYELTIVLACESICTFFSFSTFVSNIMLRLVSIRSVSSCESTG